MADVPQTLALIVVAQEYRDDIVRNINRRATALKTLKIVPGAGQNVAQSAEGDGATAEAYVDGADVSASDFGSDSQTPAIWKWGLYRGLFHTTDFARRVAASSPTPAGIRNLIGRNLVNASAKLADTLNKAIYTGSGIGQLIAGLDEAYDDGNTYATINRATGGNEFWRSHVFDPGSLTTLSFAQIRKDLGTIYDDSGEVPDLAFVSTNVFNTIAALFDSNRRYVQEIVTARGDIKLDAGYGALEIDGCMFVRDKDAPANAIYYVNSNYTEIEYLPIEPAIMAALQEMDVDVALDDGYGPIPLGCQWEKLAKVGASQRYHGVVNCALKVARPNSGGVRLNVQVVS